MISRAEHQKTCRRFFLLSLLLGPIGYFVGTSVGGFIAKVSGLWRSDEVEPTGMTAWVVMGAGCLAISVVHLVLFRRMAAGLVDRAVQLAAGADAPRGAPLSG